MAEWTRIPKIESERGVTAAAMAGRETPLELNLEARPLLRRVVDLVVHSSKRTGRRPGGPPSGSTKANASQHPLRICRIGLADRARLERSTSRWPQANKLESIPGT